jgi:hypothetical protein
VKREFFITSLVIFGQGLGIGTSLGSKFNNTTMRGKSMMAGHAVLATTTKHDSDFGIPQYKSDW